ncbi:MAG TPA: hypothetical protein VHE35_22935 [Kofleriaceae bacterium]|nr:hypothetical protein [Kofleriaceae bacterium]
MVARHAVLALAAGLAAAACAPARAAPAGPATLEIPVIPDGITQDPVVPRAEDDLDLDGAGSPAARRLLAEVDLVHRTMVDSAYQARTVVDVRRGSYHWDCSGMMTWLLKRSAPRALAALASGRPVARDFVHAIARAPVGRARRGWQRLSHVREARPGDVFAFLKSPVSPSKITGHVGVVVGYPEEVPGWPGAFAVRVADSTRGGHQDDLRAHDDDGGFGFGTMVFVTDEQGVVTSYGWIGTRSPWLMPTTVLFGRVTG